MSRSHARLLFVLSAALAVVAVPSCKRNLPPDVPPISGPQLGYVNIDYTYSMTSTDPNGDSVSYQMDWGDGTTSAWSSFVANAATVTLTKSWSTARNHFSVKARAKDRREATSSWTPEYPVIIMPNAPPDTPAAPSGPNSGYVGRYYSFYVSTSDPDGDSVSYQFNWGRSANDTTAWGNPVPSGDSYVDSVAWSSAGVYLVEARAKDTKGAATAWSAPCTTVMEVDRMKWRYGVGSCVYSSPAIGSDGSVYVGSDDDYLYAINPEGTLKWRYQTGDYVSSSPAIGSDGTVYVGSEGGDLIAIFSSGALANSAWPKFHHDNKNTGRVGGGR